MPTVSGEAGWTGRQEVELAILTHRCSVAEAPYLPLGSDGTVRELPAEWRWQGVTEPSGSFLTSDSTHLCAAARTWSCLRC